MFGMTGIELVGVTWDGRRVHLDDANEFGGFLNAKEAEHYAKQQLVDYGLWDKYEKIEVYDLNLAYEVKVGWTEADQKVVQKNEGGPPKKEPVLTIKSVDLVPAANKKRS